MGSIGELVAAIATLGTLIYLAVQIRQNTKIVKSASYQAAITSISDVAGSGYENERMADILMRAFREEALTDIEQSRFESYLTRLFRNFENFYYQHQNGMMEDHLWEGMRNSMVGYYHVPPVRRWWDARKVIYSKKYATFLERTPLDPGYLPQGSLKAEPNASDDL